MSRGIGQNVLGIKISVSFNDITVEEALVEIEQKGGFTFSYNTSKVPVNKKLAYTARNETIRDILDDILDDKYTFMIRGSFVIILPDNRSAFKSSLQITGVVRDKNTNEKIEKVTVYEVGSLRSDLTDTNGGYDLNVKSSADIVGLAVSAENYNDTIIYLSKLEAKELNIALTRSLDTAESSTLQKVDSASFTRFFVDDQSTQHLKNVSLYENRLGQVSFVPGIGTNRKFSGLISNDISLNAIAGYSYGVNAVELGGVMNFTRKYARGFQAAGVGNMVGGTVSGVQLAGVFNYNHDSTNGVQLSGIFNIVNGGFSGVQGSGIFNTNIGSMNGLQMAGIYNVAFGDVHGLQMAGIMNISQDVKKGHQIAGVFNRARNINGLQLSGVFNIAKNVKGVQIGIINFADSLDGVAIGLFSFVRSGLKQFAIESNSVNQLNLEFRSGVQKFYNVLSAGMRFYGEDAFWSYGIGFGSQTDIGKRFVGSAELMTNTIKQFNQSADSLDMLNKLKLTIGFKLKKHLSIHTGPTFNVYISQHVDPESGQYGQGIATNPFFDRVSGRTLTQMWFGYTFQLRF